MEIIYSGCKDAQKDTCNFTYLSQEEFNNTAS